MTTSNRRLVFSATAASDLREIVRHSLISWGEARAQAYADDLLRSCDRLLLFPGLGVDRSDLGYGLRSLVSNQHVVLFKPSDDEILVVRFLHYRMDAHMNLNG